MVVTVKMSLAMPHVGNTLENCTHANTSPLPRSTFFEVITLRVVHPEWRPPILHPLLAVTVEKSASPPMDLASTQNRSTVHLLNSETFLGTSVANTIHGSTVIPTFRTFSTYSKHPQGTPCNRYGHFLPPGTPPASPPPRSDDDWAPFASRAGFETAEFLYVKTHLSHGDIDQLLALWSATLAPHNDFPPFVDHQDLHAQIDAIRLGHVPWRSYTAQYQGLRPDGGPIPEWMDAKYELWYPDPRKIIHNLLTNPEFVSGIDYAPHRDFQDGKRQYGDFMSGDWAWDQCVGGSQETHDVH